MELIKKYTKKIVNPSILDVATGKGGFLKKLIQFIPSYDLAVGIDSDPVTLGEAKKNLPNGKLEFIFAEAEKIPFENNSFDLVSMSNALHHVADIEKTLVEMQRVCKKEGYIIINEMIRDDLNEAQTTFLQFHDLKCESDQAKGIRHNKVYTKEKIIEYTTSAGLHVIESTTHFQKNKPILTAEELKSRLDDVIVGLEHTDIHDAIKE
ncbi:MAG: class I SAM-dependent methyltransferase, partial [Bacteroidota bacterium]